MEDLNSNCFRKSNLFSFQNSNKRRKGRNRKILEFSEIVTYSLINQILYICQHTYIVHEGRKASRVQGVTSKLALLQPITHVYKNVWTGDATIKIFLLQYPQTDTTNSLLKQALKANVAPICSLSSSSSSVACHTTAHGKPPHLPPLTMILCSLIPCTARFLLGLISSH